VTFLQWFFDVPSKPRARTVPPRDKVLETAQRKLLRSLIPPLLDKWQPVLGVQTSFWGIKRMKTRWGTCNPSAKRIWLALALATKPPELLEYVVVHELVHLLEPSHNARFKALMTQFLPDWKRLREQLK